MVVDASGGAEERYRKACQDRCPGSVTQGVKCVHVCTFGRRRVSVSLLCPSARPGMDSLQLERVTNERCARCSVSCVHVLVERPGCGQREFGVIPKADGSKRSYRKARMCATSRRRSYCKQVQKGYDTN